MVIDVDFIQIVGDIEYAFPGVLFLCRANQINLETIQMWFGCGVHLDNCNVEIEANPL